MVGLEVEVISPLRAGEVVATATTMEVFIAEAAFEIMFASGIGATIVDFNAMGVPIFIERPVVIDVDNFSAFMNPCFILAVTKDQPSAAITAIRAVKFNIGEGEVSSLKAGNIIGS